MSFTPSDLQSLKATVRRKSPASLNFQDCEDLTGDILATALKTASRTGLPPVRLAQVDAKRTDRYRRAGVRASLAHPEIDHLELERRRRRPTEPIANPIDLSLEFRDIVLALPEDSRRAYVALEIEGLTLAEFAARQEISVSAAYRLHTAARRQLKAAWSAAEAA